MIRLCVNDQQVSILEWMLKINEIPYQIEFEAPDCHLGFPYLIVDGVPLDFERAIKWIRGKRNEY